MIKHRLGKIASLLAVFVLVLSTTACTADEPAFIDSTTPINVNVSGGTVTGTVAVSSITGITPVDTGFVSIPYYYQISEGAIAGHYPFVMSGYNPNIGTSSETVWEYSATYPLLTAGIQMEVVSTSGNDSAAGSGMQQVILVYLDHNYVEHSEIITLNGLTAVPTAGLDIFRVNYFSGYRFGNTYVCAGNISLKAVGAAPVYSYIVALGTTAQTAAYAVPEGKTLFLTSISYSTAEASKGVILKAFSNYDFRLQSQETFFTIFSRTTSYNTSTVINFDVPLKFPEHTTIGCACISGLGGATATVIMRGWEEID